MPGIFLKLIPVMIFGGVFVYVLFNVPYPNSLAQASFNQLLTFFGSLFFLLLFLINIFLNYLLISAIISGGGVILLLLKGLAALNLVSALLVILAVYFFVSFLKKNHKKNQKPKTGSNPILPNLTPIRSGLTSKINIPRLKSLYKKK